MSKRQSSRPDISGQHYVEDDEGGALLEGFFERLGATLRLDDFETGALEAASDQFQYVFLVVSDEDGVVHWQSPETLVARP